MKLRYLFILLLFLSIGVWAQEAIQPDISPVLFRYNDEITITYDVTGTPLANLTEAFAWVWIPNSDTDAKYNINPANTNSTLTDHAKFTKSISDGKTIFTLVFTPSEFFSDDISSETKMGILLKGNDWPNGKTTDYLSDIWDGSFLVKLLSPTQQSIFTTLGEEILIEAETPVTVNFELYIDDILVDTKNGISQYEYSHTVNNTEGQHLVKIIATDGINVSEATFTYIISSPSIEQSRPGGIIAGINYHEDDTKVTLCLLAPGKASVYVLGDFNNWEIDPNYQMKRDGEYFWLEISNLNSGTEYGYQYLVNESLRLADPFADKILDPNDQYIPATSYPNLKPYPAKALSDIWYFNRVSVFQTAQTPYQWQVQNFQKPPKEELIIYEVLIRDFFGENGRTYKNLTDTIGYFKRLGVNAIELMPVMEFNGNDSWGYNPTFKFAPDKYYGPKNDLKEFIDRCHQEGIAVILDIVMNHHDMPNPYVLMDFNFTLLKPTANNKWFNTDATHPYNVFFDMNHESQYTQDYLDTVNHYWLNEFKVDGFRYDLSKGFTQVNSGNNVGQWGNRDASRIALLKRMADKIWGYSPDAYVILEHFADNTEEKELAEYRSDEGLGMLFWGNLNHAYNQNTMGHSADNDIRWVYHGTRSWSVPHVIGYMESHDEERMMYRNLNFGNASGNYDTKNPATALERMEAAALMFYLIPGPKMLWQFGEMGYDLSINLCDNGTINNDCRVSAKPPRWNYLSEPNRKSLFNHTANLLELRKEYEVFRNGTVDFIGGNNLVKQISLTSQSFSVNPSSPEEMSARLIANFGLSQTSVSISLPHAGTWYDYYKRSTAINSSGSTYNLTLEPGEYRLLIDYPIESPVTSTSPALYQHIRIFPNPVDDQMHIQVETGELEQISLWTVAGQKIKNSHQDFLDLKGLPSGIYIAEIKISGRVYRHKIMKN